MSASEWYRMFVLEREWTAEQFEAWYASSLSSVLLRADVVRR
jgi:hypothetical protein